MLCVEKSRWTATPPSCTKEGNRLSGEKNGRWNQALALYALKTNFSTSCRHKNMVVQWQPLWWSLESCSQTQLYSSVFLAQQASWWRAKWARRLFLAFLFKSPPINMFWLRWFKLPPIRLHPLPRAVCYGSLISRYPILTMGYRSCAALRPSRWLNTASQWLENRWARITNLVVEVRELDGDYYSPISRPPWLAIHFICAMMPLSWMFPPSWCILTTRRRFKVRCRSKQRLSSGWCGQWASPSSRPEATCLRELQFFGFPTQHLPWFRQVIVDSIEHEHIFFRY